jgi:hypothetical protein
MLGRWDEALAIGAEFTQEQILAGGVVLSLLQTGVSINVERGDLDAARRVFEMFSHLEQSTDVQDLTVYLSSRAALHRGEGQQQEALADAEATIETAGATLPLSFQSVKQAVVESIEAALALGESAKVEKFLESIETIPAGTPSPYLAAHARRFRARMADDSAGLAAAADQFRSLGLPFWLAVTLLEHAEASGDESQLVEAREIFEELKAGPWLDRADSIGADRSAVPA